MIHFIVKASTKYDQKTKSGRNKTTNSDLDKNDIHLPKANRDERESIDDLKDEECLYQRSPEQGELLYMYNDHKVYNAVGLCFCNGNIHVRDKIHHV